jgi:hypothetical protein
MKDKAIKGMMFKNRNREEYVFDNDKVYDTIMEPTPWCLSRILLLKL